MLQIGWDDLAATLEHPFIHEEIGTDLTPLLAVNIESPTAVCTAAQASALSALPAVTVGLISDHLGDTDIGTDMMLDPSVVAAFDVLVGPANSRHRSAVSGDTTELLDDLARHVAASPQASVVLAQLLRMTAAMPVRDALIAESLAYSVLQTGPVFREWLASSPHTSGAINERAKPPGVSEPPVLIDSHTDHWVITLNRPDRHNAFSLDLRDRLVEALRAAQLGGAHSIRLRGNGPTFCSGGDLTEFGTTPDSATAHMVRSVRSAPWWVHECRTLATFELHGRCFGAGIELAAFANHIVADPATTVCLPEVAFGLIPGAGGTVSITRRTGRHRTLWLAVTGASLDAETAQSWGLIDDIGVKPENAR